MTTQADERLLKSLDEWDRLGDDLLSGAKAIADYLGWPKQKVDYKVRAGLLPVTHVGRRLYARKSELQQMFSPGALRVTATNQRGSHSAEVGNPGIGGEKQFKPVRSEAAE